MSRFTTIAVYDTETTGLNSDYDQVLEFAGLKLDLAFNIIPGSERVIPVRPRLDVPPHPEACLTHGLNLERLRNEGVSEYEFARMFADFMGRPGTLISGYNTIGYDDEIMRRNQFRNLMDPYGHEWRDGNARMDVYNVVRTLYAFDPETLNWPTNEDGEVSLKLSALTGANNISHDKAHDAMSDVKATADLLWLINGLGTPWLQRCMDLTDKRQVEKLLAKKEPLFHVSSFYSKARAFGSLILPVIRDASANNKVLCVDLAEDPTEMLKMSAEEIRHHRFAPRNARGENPPPVPATSIQINKQPTLAQVKDVAPSLHARMGIDLKVCMERAKMILADRAFMKRLQDAYRLDLPEPSDVYGTLYSGSFFSRADTVRRDKVHCFGPNGQPALATQRAHVLAAGAEDNRLYDLIVRAQGLHFPGSLVEPEDHDRFHAYLERRLFSEQQELGLTIAGAREAMDMCRLDRILSDDDELVLKDLSKHLDWMESEVQRIKTRELPLEVPGEPVHGLIVEEGQVAQPQDAAAKAAPAEAAPVAGGGRRRANPFPASTRRGAQAQAAVAETRPAPPAEPPAATASEAPKAKPVITRDMIPF